MIYDYANKARYRHGNAWWIGLTNFPKNKTRPYEQVRGFRDHWEIDIDGNGRRDPDTGEKIITWFKDIAQSKLVVLNPEPVPEAGANTDAEQEAFNDWGVGACDYAQEVAGGACLIGAFYPYFNPRIAAMRYDGTLDTKLPGRDELVRRWWGRIKSGRDADTGRFERTSFLDRIHVMNSPVFGNADLHPETWLPEMCDWMRSINIEWIPHVWAYAKVRGTGEIVMQRREHYVWIIDYLHAFKVRSVIEWITGIGPFTAEENWRYDAINERFGDAA